MLKEVGGGLRTMVPQHENVISEAQPFEGFVIQSYLYQIESVAFH